MRILYTLLLVIGAPSIFLGGCLLAVGIEEFMRQHFGDPPAWLIISNVSIFAFGMIMLAWDTAGKWVKK